MVLKNAHKMQELISDFLITSFADRIQFSCSIVLLVMEGWETFKFHVGKNVQQGSFFVIVLLNHPPAH